MIVFVSYFIATPPPYVQISINRFFCVWWGLIFSDVGSISVNWQAMCVAFAHGPRKHHANYLRPGRAVVWEDMTVADDSLLSPSHSQHCCRCLLAQQAPER